MSIVIAVIIFGLIVIVHEVGHFVAARRAGILVEEFAIGMGPRLLSKKKGDTVYSLRLFPIGGFCKMLGDEESSDDPRAYNNKSVFRRVCVSLGGVLMNFVLAFLVFLILCLTAGMYLPEVSEVIPDSPAAAAGLMPGDRVIRLNGSKINIYDDFRLFMTDNGGRTIDVTFRRGAEVFVRSITPMYSEENEGYLIGFRPTVKTGLLAGSVQGVSRAGFLESLKEAFFSILFWIRYIVLSLIRLVTHLSTAASQMAGPIGIVRAIGTTYAETKAVSIWATVQTMANLMALISANLGVFNLLPLPALDGGRLIFLAIEGIRRKPIDRNKEGMVHFVGFIALMVLAVFIAFNDIRVWSGI